ncbi:sensor histidine kinase [Streptomyces sp. NPDC051940]|uniref:sensor histidine kinase n=1 Tax=Streptomyces sp. NPDC051940 TaxID=3155675 RepID=UPI003446F5A2
MSAGLRRPAVAAVTLALAGIAEVLARGTDPGDDIVYSVLLCVGTTVPLALLRSQIVIAALTITAAGMLSVQSPPVLTVAGAVSQLIVLYWLGLSGSRPLSLLLVLPYLVRALGDGDATGRTYAVLLAVGGAALAATGSAQRARTDARALTETEQVMADTLIAHAARGERARIARELHDVVAHHISMISVQAETARLTTPGMPEAGAKRLRDIGDTARAALTEMRRLLGVLREDSGVTAPQRRPQPGLTQLNELLDEARDATGAAARLIVSGAVAPLDPGIELTAYRIVQEALTNARRHAPGAAVDVEMHYTEDTLLLRVRDNGPGPGHSPASPGHGILGMQERAHTVGGELRTGPAPGGGFLVEARLPVPQEA